MGQNIDMLTRPQAQEIGFDRTAYLFPEKTETFNAVLQAKIYGERCIYCYFLTTDSRKIRLPLWYDRRRNNSFHPYKSEIDFGKVLVRTDWTITIDVNKKGKLTWFDAVPLTEV